MGSCNLILERRRGESDHKFLRRFQKWEKQNIKELREKCAWSRRFDSKSVKAKKKREKAQRQREADKRRQAKRAEYRRKKRLNSRR